MSLWQIFESLGHSPIGIYMSQSAYAFPVAEMIHLLALAALGGGILIIDLRVLGLGLKAQAPELLLEALRPYLMGCLIAAASSGLLLLSAEVEKCYYNPAFRIKMLLLLAALLFSTLVQPRFLHSKTSAVLSLLLWLSVGLAGRAIGVI